MKMEILEKYPENTTEEEVELMKVEEMASFIHKEENEDMLCNSEAIIRERDAQGSEREERGKYKTIDKRMEDLRRYKVDNGHCNVSRLDDKLLYKFCCHARHGHNNPGKGMKMTDERIVALDEIGFSWNSQECITMSFDERIQYLQEYKRTQTSFDERFDERIRDLQEYRRTHGHIDVKRRDDGKG